MSESPTTYEANLHAENSRGSTRPASARSTRSASHNISITYTLEQRTEYKYRQFPPPPSAHGLGTEVLPLSAREIGTNGPASPPAPSREPSNTSRPRSATSQAKSGAGGAATAAGEGRPPSREGSRPASAAGGNSNSHSHSRPQSRNSNTNSRGHPEGAGGGGDLLSEAMPWNELRGQGSHTGSAVNSIAPYVNRDREPQPAAAPSREASRDGARARSRPSSATPSNRSTGKGALLDVIQSGEGDMVLAGSPPVISRESSHLATPAPSIPPARSSASGGSRAGRMSPSHEVDSQTPFAYPHAVPPQPEQQPSQRPPRSPSVASSTRDPQQQQLGASMSGGARSVGGGRKSLGGNRSSTAGDYMQGGPAFESLPWSTQALMDFRNQMKRCSFELLDPADNPLTARLDQVFSLPQDLWPVLPPGALYCMESDDPRFTFSYLQHTDFPSTKVKVGTYFGKWGRHLVDFVVSWQPTPRSEAAWQPGGAKQPPLPWEPRQVVAHTTNGEYQYTNTRMRFRGPQSTELGAATVDWSDVHGIDLMDTKAGNEHAPRNSDKDREAHLLDPPRPNTWGEMARRPLIGNLRNKGGGAYVHHVNYDFSGLRTTCGRRVPSGYFFTLIPNNTVKTPAVPGNQSRARSASVGRSLAGGRSRASSSFAPAAAGDPSFATVYSLLSSVAMPSGAITGSGGVTMTQSVQAALTGILDGAGAGGGSGRSTGNGGGASRPGSAGASRRSSSGSLPPSARLLPTLESVRSFGGMTGVTGATAALTTASRPAPTASPTLFSLAPKQKWRTYDVPFHHPIHTAKATELGAVAAAAAGTHVRGFSDAAAVLQVSEQELRLAKAFVPAPIVVRTWEDVPRLYARHMAAARELMPVTELDTYGSSKLHQLLYHLEAAATLEFDRLDAKLALLPQMARLGKRSAEIDAWLQVIVEHATYLYEKIQINNTIRWPLPSSIPASEASASSLDAAGPPPAAQPSAFRRSVTFSKGTPLVAPNPTTAPAGSTGGLVWAFPEPLAGTSFMEKSALSIAAQQRKAAAPIVQHLPAHRVTVEEWASVLRVMDTCRHAILYDNWVKLRPAMTGFNLPASSAYSPAGSRAGSVLGSDAAATIHSLGGDPDVPVAQLDANFAHGMVNRELLDYMKEDMAAMAAPDFTPAPLGPDAALPPPRGFHGPGPLPAEAVAEMPVPPRPARIRGAEETPLPPELEVADLWNTRNKADQSTYTEPPSELDVGALRVSQASVGRLQAAKSFAATHQAEVRRSMLRARGERVWDDQSSVPDYGSDIAEDEMEVDNSTGEMRRRPNRRHDDINPHVEPVAPGMACQTTDDLEGPSPAEKILDAATKVREAEAAAETRRRLLMGNGGRTREQILDEALAAAEAAIRSLQPRPVGAASAFAPPTPKGMLGDGPGSAEAADAPWKPFGRTSTFYAPGSDAGGSAAATPVGQPQQSGRREWYQRSGSMGRAPQSGESYGKGPEPLALEKVTAEPSFMSEMEAHMSAEDGQKKNSRGTNNNSAPFATNPVGLGGLVDYETAMARRRAIAGAELFHDKSDYLPKSEVFNLFITYCNLGGHPELVEMLERSIEAPLSTATVTAKAKASAATAAAAAGYGGRHHSQYGQQHHNHNHAASSYGARGSAAQALLEKDQEEEQQRIRSTAWLLGVTWRRIPNETYNSFLARVLCWPADVALSMHRTRATQIIAKALVRGHDISQVPK